MTKPLPESREGMLDLAERCEAATGPDRELDARIECELRFGGGWEEKRREGHAPSDFNAPAYTASLDAAMTLVPEGAIWEVGHKVNYPAGSGERDRAHYAFVNVGKPGHVKSFNGKSFATPALAVCAAALKARATPPGPSGNQG